MGKRQGGLESWTPLNLLPIFSGGAGVCIDGKFSFP